MPQVMIGINRAAGQPQAKFEPPVQSVTSLDNLFWVNNDEQAAHQPTPNINDPTAWMPQPIPVKLPDQPAPTSRGMAFGEGPYQITYFCAVKGHEKEKGVINVTS